MWPFKKKPVYKVYQLVTPDNLVYTVRDREGHEREIFHHSTGEWKKESETTFSLLPCFEDYHREQYKKSRFDAIGAEGE